MSARSRIPEPLRIASDLSPVLFGLGDPDLLVELLSSNPAGVVLVEATPELTVAYCNEAFRRLAPLGRRPVVGRPLPDLFAWIDRPAMRASYREVVRSGMPLHWRSAPYHEPSGSSDRVAYRDVSHFPLRGSDGRVTHVLSFAVDVTDQAGARARMGEAQQRVLAALGGIARQLTTSGERRAVFGELSATMADLVCATRVAFWLYDGDSRTVSAQPGAFGFTAAELELVRTIPCRPGGADPLEQVVFDDLVLREEVDAAPGSPYGAALDALGVSDAITVPWRAGGRNLGAVGVYGSTRCAGFTDEDVWVLRAAATVAALVWEHRQADEALAELRERESASLRQQMDQSIQLEHLKADFLNLASHELRGPLGVVRGYISMMEDGTLAPVGEHVEQVLPLIRAKLDEMNQLIDEMLETARLEDSALRLRLAPLDLREVVHRAVRSLEPLAGERHRLVTEVPGAPVPVEGDPSRLTMVVTNLVHNALKYSPGGGEVRVSCTAAAGRAEIAVSDQGVGIAAEDAGRLFTRFGRVVTPETGGIGGTGWGLYLARDLARRHGGEVTVESAPGRGSTFTLTLPLAAD
ncbi:MAG TPA: ATP-binding protein [Candidatus Eisenbacteria bacterium]|nr:ATP-binding protein [Candidatus Eisenbacteria bacterium]